MSRATRLLLSLLILGSVFVPSATVRADVPKGKHGVAEKLWFDTCSTPSESQMQAWWATSPYNDIGVYLGGPNFPSSVCDTSNLTAAWVNDVNNMGWSFVTIWVGLQSACTSAKFVISANTTTAFNQGKTAADNATAAAAPLGFTTGTIIYLDIEAFSSTNSGCVASADAYVSGWATEMKALGDLSGVYGTGSDANTWWVGANPRPVRIWLAWWNQTTHTGASVWDISGVTNDEWNHDTRHHQFQGGHNHTYNGVTLNVDDDCANGTVAPYGNDDVEPVGSKENQGPTEDPTCAT